MLLLLKGKLEAYETGLDKLDLYWLYKKIYKQHDLKKEFQAGLSWWSMPMF